MPAAFSPFSGKVLHSKKKRSRRDSNLTRCSLKTTPAPKSLISGNYFKLIDRNNLQSR
jgi:hypothetical protein